MKEQKPMTRRDARILHTAIAVSESGRRRFGPSELASQLRASAEPLWIWEVRQSLASLERAGSVRMDPLTAAWEVIAIDPAAD